MRIRCLAFACCLVGLPQASASASVLLQMSLPELVEGADQIVVSQVLKVSAQWDAAHHNIETTIELLVDENWKGQVPSDRKITLVQPGGEVGDMEMSVQGIPRFTKGERAVLFLRGKERRLVLGMNQGKRPVTFERSSRRYWVERSSKEEVVEVKKPEAAPKQAADDRIPLDTLREQVRMLLQK